MAATDSQLTEWAGVTAPMLPGKLQEWSLLVDSQAVPLAKDQRELVEELLDDLGAEHIEVLDSRPTRFSLANTRARRETLPVSFIPTVSGKPVSWRVRFAWYATAQSVPWPAEPDPTQAVILLDSVGGKIVDAPPPDPSFLEKVVTVGDAIGELNTQAQNTARIVAGAVMVAGLVYLYMELRKK
jgi:hypothetical protein